MEYGEFAICRQNTTLLISGVPLDEATVEVRTSAPLVNDYSAAVALFIQGQDGPFELPAS